MTWRRGRLSRGFQGHFGQKHFGFIVRSYLLSVFQRNVIFRALAEISVKSRGAYRTKILSNDFAIISWERYYGAQNDYTHFYGLGMLNFPTTQDICYTGFSGMNFSVLFGRLHNIFSVNPPITHINCLGISCPITHTHICYTKEFFPNYCAIISGLIVFLVWNSCSSFYPEFWLSRALVLLWVHQSA